VHLEARVLAEAEAHAHGAQLRAVVVFGQGALDRLESEAHKSN
jgi:hypothetical protein